MCLLLRGKRRVLVEAWNIFILTFPKTGSELGFSDGLYIKQMLNTTGLAVTQCNRV